MDFIMGNFFYFFDLFKDWIILKDIMIKFYGYLQIVCFGFYLVFVFCCILVDILDEVVVEKLRIVGDFIFNGYVIFFFIEY